MKLLFRTLLPAVLSLTGLLLAGASGGAHASAYAYSYENISA